MKRAGLTILVSAVLLVLTAPAGADIITLLNTKDTGFTPSDTGLGSVGKYGYMNADLNPDRRMITQWDLSSIPAGAIINSAQIIVYRFSSTDDPNGDPFSAFALTTPWAEGHGMSNGGYPVGYSPDGSNWKYSNIATLAEWATPGGDINLASEVQFTGVAIPDPSVGGVVIGFNPDITAIAQGWLTSNNGLLIKTRETSYQRHAMRTRDYGYPDDGQDRPAPGMYAPKLIVDYTVPEPMTMSILALGGLGLLAKKRR